MTDPISDMLVRIRNGIKAGHAVIELPGSKIKGEIARVMKAEGYITDFTMTDDVPRVLSIELKYNDRAESAICGLTRESRPGLRKYCGVEDIPEVLDGLGTAILSTSRGVMSGKEARQLKVGGELLCTIW
ncbi:MAG: 30S ribosomal protein S8 [Kiritimatiellae bacterium]|nr:30S ribosomal protein S8 [Kiritimatiellia bacterium]